jgi:hypothetical protein
MAAKSFDCENVLSFHFENKEAANHFKVWMSEQGEQDYWNWMDAQESEETGSITGIVFDYHQNSHIPVKCGRLSDE